MTKKFLKAKWKQDLGDLDVFIDEESIERIIPRNGGLQAVLRGSSEVYIIIGKYTYTTDDIFDLSNRKNDKVATRGYCGGLK